MALRVLFERTARAYLPEVDAYLAYLRRFPGVEVVDSRASPEVRPEDVDVVWRFMGLDRAGAPGRRLVQEYNSLSTGRWPRLRNRVKRLVNARPDHRVFLSTHVRDEFGFRDSAPYSLRDMGVPDAFFRDPAQRGDPEFDFIYVGSIGPARDSHIMLRHFTDGPGRGSRLLLVGDATADLVRQYSRRGNIVFAGRMAHHEIPDALARARWGLNVMPQRYPLTEQTPTKVLEFCAAGLGVASNDYPWARRFAEERCARIFWLQPDLSNLTAAAVEAADPRPVDVTDRRWDRVIHESGAIVDGLALDADS